MSDRKEFSISEVIDSFGINGHTWLMFALLGLANIFDGYDFMVVNSTNTFLAASFGMVTADPTAPTGYVVNSAAMGSLTTWGLLGMVVGVPLFAVIYDLVRKLVKLGLRKRGKQELWEQYTADYPNENMPKPNEEPEPIDWSLNAMKERGLSLLEESKNAWAATVAWCTKAWALLKKWVLVIWGYLKKAAQWVRGQIQRVTARMRSKK